MKEKAVTSKNAASYDPLSAPEGEALKKKGWHKIAGVWQKGDLQIIEKPDGGFVATGKNNKEIAAAFVALGKERGWKDMTFEGSEDFKREAMSQALAAGIKVTPQNAQDREILEELSREIER